MREEYRRFLDPQVVSRISNMELRARLVVEGFITGLHRSPYHGFSVEFAEHRQYMPGDEIRRIDWKVYGRTGRHYVKQYEEETNLKAYIVLDASRSMAFASPGRVSKIEYASSLAAALAYMMIRQQDAVGLAVFDEAVTSYLPPHATKTYLRQLLIALQQVQPARRTGAARSLHQVAERIRRRGLVIVLSDLLEDPADVMAALKHFRHRKNEVLVMHLLDPLERSFDFGEDARFRDMETGDQMVTQPWQVGRAYRRSMEEFCHRYKKECGENYIDYVLLDTTVPFDTALVRYLQRREMLG
ncbi:MAG: DUF58 domain-containing protein [Bacteroidota bacterium]